MQISCSFFCGRNAFTSIFRTGIFCLPRFRHNLTTLDKLRHFVEGHLSHISSHILSMLFGCIISAYFGKLDKLGIPTTDYNATSACFFLQQKNRLLQFLWFAICSDAVAYTARLYYPQPNVQRLPFSPYAFGYNSPTVSR